MNDNKFEVGDHVLLLISSDPVFTFGQKGVISSTTNDKSDITSRQYEVWFGLSGHSWWFWGDELTLDKEYYRDDKLNKLGI